jgi:hypothetical protein
MTYDPFVPKEQAENNGELLAHYQAPLTNGQDVFMEFISGTYVSCNPPGSYTPFPCGNDNWFNQVWSEKRLHWEGGQLDEKWSFASDWKPAPDAGGELGGWQPVFHAALSNDVVWVPGAGGTVFELSYGSGKMINRFNPFGSSIDPNTFVTSPITVDAQGNVYSRRVSLSCFWAQYSARRRATSETNDLAAVVQRGFWPGRSDRGFWASGVRALAVGP